MRRARRHFASNEEAVSVEINCIKIRFANGQARRTVNLNNVFTTVLDSYSLAAHLTATFCFVDQIDWPFFLTAAAPWFIIQARRAGKRHLIALKWSAMLRDRRPRVVGESRSSWWCESRDPWAISLMITNRRRRRLLQQHYRIADVATKLKKCVRVVCVAKRPAWKRVHVGSFKPCQEIYCRIDRSIGI